jgi:hypothetical protein
MAIERWWDKRSEIVEPDAANDNYWEDWRENWKDDEEN